MIKEELEKEAEEYVSKYQGWGGWTPHKGSAVYYAMLNSYIDSAEPREKQIAELSKHIVELQEDKGELTDKVKELEAQIDKMKCYLPVDERDSDHKWFAYKNLFDTEWKIDYSVQGELPKCNTIKWFENKEAVMFYLVSNGMKYYEEPRR